MSNDLNAMHFDRTGTDHTGADGDDETEADDNIPGDDDLWAKLD